MGFLKRFFSKDPETLLDKATQAVERGEAVQALSILADLPDDLDGGLAGRAKDLEGSAHDHLSRAAVESSEAYESEGWLDRAAEELDLAIEHCRDEAARERLTEKARQLQEAIEAESAASGNTAGGDSGLNADESYSVLVAMLREDVAERYADRSSDFRKAYVDFNEGRTEEALEVFDRLVEDAPDDAVSRFERGHCLLALGKPEEARPDLEAAWELFGDESLDVSGSLSVPLLWADAMLELREHQAVVDRLQDLADPRNGNPALSMRLAVARIELEQLDEANEHLGACCVVFPSEPAFSHLHASLLRTAGETGHAIEVLERAVAPSCASGSCAKPPLHLPSLRLLTSLHLDADDGTSRAWELMQFVAAARQGQLESVDHYLLARLQRADGDEEAFARELEAAHALLPEGDTDLKQALAKLEAGTVEG
ncbi:MAG: DUF6381 family protein [Acidobacteriota bacterium]